MISIIIIRVYFLQLFYKNVLYHEYSINEKWKYIYKVQSTQVESTCNLCIRHTCNNDKYLFDIKREQCDLYLISIIKYIDH